ncbi:dTDP-4-dehydrorhamnose reductase [Mycoavidus sp. SF9855]|uniref:dTDP-4-dehydrorhamnose reductase n=1 Tax=Mycoavidus sp. SF9855 TaxID=2968475 RepID=UPI00211CA36E|nr:dTDP-4-dehydrorhamnose reductase [Mycoavidus sp. SF9855]UUM21269.1 dTDP-4-dehydrorhamnose reductase [Mycoavidus sp. SF9855]
MTLSRTILITGAQGQLGFELARSLQGLGRIVALDRQALDLADFDQIRRVVRALRPALIVNPAAYTAVDQAEIEEPVALRINALAPGVLAEEAKRLNAVLVHYSTDYVFAGDKDGAYTEEDSAQPQNAYGRSKLAGERALAEVGAAHFVLRTSWIYGKRGKNFLLTMLQLAAQQPELRIVANQYGAPTWSTTIAALSAQILAQGIALGHQDRSWWQEKSGIYHLSAAGSTSWYEFAQAIFTLAPPARPPKLTPISALEYLTPAKRPANSRLSNDKLARTFNLFAPHWHDALRLCLRPE